MALRQQQAHTDICEDTLFHGETLFVVAARDLDDVPLPLFSERVGLDLLAHAPLVEHAQLALIVNFKQLLAASGRVRHVQLHSGLFI